ncbi:MAG: PTS fructose transporter subunit IIA, partial [Chromatiales bacterium]
MAVGLLLITHDGIGRDLLATALSTLGSSPLETASLSVSQTDEPDAVLARAIELADAMDDGDGVLVLTDMYGSTPSNIASRLVRERGWRLIAGVNLPM